jgi:hypothetical protein
MVARILPTGPISIPAALAQAQLVLGRLENAVPGPVPSPPAVGVYYIVDFMAPDGLDYLISKAAQWVDKISQLPANLQDDNDQQLDQVAFQIEDDVLAGNLDKRITPNTRTYTQFTIDVEGINGLLSDLGVII